MDPLANIVIKQDEIGPFLKRTRAELPENHRRAMRSTAQWARKKFREDFNAANMAGTQLAPLAPLTLEIRAEQQRASDTRKAQRYIGGLGMKEVRRVNRRTNAIRKVMVENKATKAGLQRALGTNRNQLGGKLPGLVEYAVSETGNEPTITVGFIGTVFAGANKSSAKFQIGETRAFNTAERRGFHRLFATDDLAAKGVGEYRKARRALFTPYVGSAAFNAEWPQVYVKAFTQEHGKKK